MRHSVCRAIVSLCLLLAASITFAAAPGLMNYQGILTDAGGAVVSDGDYSVTFAIYADSVAVTPLWSETRVVNVADGLFNELLGSPTPLTPELFAATPRWMGLTVENDPEMTPRMKIGSVPWALRAAVADSALAVAGGGGAGDGHSLDANDGDPEDVVYVNSNGLVGIGTTVPLHHLHLIGSDTLGSVMIAPNSSINDKSEIRLAEDSDGTYGMFLRYNGSVNEFELGGWAGAVEYGPHMTVARNYPIIEFNGAGGTAHFDMSATGNGSIQLPNNAINALEILDEPGVACSTKTNAIQYIGTSPTVLVSRSIVCPAAGYVFSIGTAFVQWHVGGTSASDCDFALSDQSAVMPDALFSVTRPGYMSTGTYNTPVTIHDLFPVAAAGTYTYYFLAEEQLGDFKAYDKKLTLVYIPTAYGNVTAPAAAGPMTVDPDAAAERAESEAFNTARIEREMSELRADVEALREKMRAAEER